MTVTSCYGVDPEGGPMRSVYDFEVCSNNGTLALRPDPSGRFKGLMKTLLDGQQRCWVFGDVQTWTDENGVERFDHHRRGVLVGTLSQWEGFFEMCHKLGVQIGNIGFFVPFSNGQHRAGKFGYDGKGEAFSDYTEEELRLARIDLPTESELKVLILEQAKF
jgi:hypothetical protein